MASMMERRRRVLSKSSARAPIATLIKRRNIRALSLADGSKYSSTSSAASATIRTWLSCGSHGNRPARSPLGGQSMSSTVRQLADLVGGQVEGDGEIIIECALPLREAGAGAI